MRLTLALTDQRNKNRTLSAYTGRPIEYEDYERAALDGSGDAHFIAQVLRGLADEIDPLASPEPLADWERDLLRGDRP